MAQMVIVGKFGSVHGVKGDIRVHSFTDPSDNILQYLPWQVRPTKSKTWEQIDISHSHWHGDQLLVRVGDITDRDEVKRYTNYDIGITRDQLPAPDEDEYYWSDLMGMTVVNQDGVKLGVIDSYLETGANDVMVIKGDQEHLIPYTDDAVKSVDLDTNTMTVHWDLDEA